MTNFLTYEIRMPFWQLLLSLLAGNAIGGFFVILLVRSLK